MATSGGIGGGASTHGGGVTAIGTRTVRVGTHRVVDSAHVISSSASARDIANLLGVGASGGLALGDGDRGFGDDLGELRAGRRCPRVDLGPGRAGFERGDLAPSKPRADESAAGDNRG